MKPVEFVAQLWLTGGGECDGEPVMVLGAHQEHAAIVMMPGGDVVEVPYDRLTPNPPEEK